MKRQASDPALAQTDRFCHPSGWQWIETSNGTRRTLRHIVSAILRDGSGLKHGVRVRLEDNTEVSAILRDGSGLKQNLRRFISFFCRVSAILRDGSGLKQLAQRDLAVGLWFLPSFGMAVD